MVASFRNESTAGTVAAWPDDAVTDNAPDPFWSGVADELPCHGPDPDLWFAESPAKLDVAKSFCRDCPVRLACLRGALQRREPWGVWGGEIFEHGVVIARKRGRGRPPKSGVVAAEQRRQCGPLPGDELAS